jgi:D-xylose transport system substrate-binding protein
VSQRLDEIDPREVNSIPLGADGNGESVVVRVGKYWISLPREGVERETLDAELREAGVRATIRAHGDGPEVRVRRDDGSAESSVAWDEELAGELQGQALADCLGTLDGQRVARVGVPSADQRLGQTFVLEPLLEQDVLRPAADVRDADAVLAADDGAAARALTQAGSAAVVVGRGATTAGVRNVVADRQCVTLFQSPERMAKAAAALAVVLADGEGAPRHPPQLAPAVVTAETVAEHIDEPGFPRRADICAGTLERPCDELGL